MLALDLGTYKLNVNVVIKSKSFRLKWLRKDLTSLHGGCGENSFIRGFSATSFILFNINSDNFVEAGPIPRNGRG